MPDQTFAIRSPSNALVLDPSDWTSIATFTTRKAARAYADSILPSMPSKDTPLRVVAYTEADRVERDRQLGCAPKDARRMAELGR